MSLDFDAFDAIVSRVRTWAVELLVVTFVGPLGSVPIIQGWFGGGWRFCIHIKVLLFMIQIQIT